MIVGLGNPGPKYEKNRHNAGFMVLDRLASDFREKFKGRWAKAQLAGREVVLLKPMTYMNLSGESVSPAMQFFKENLSDVIVVHDEIDLPFGTVRLKWGGGAAGHNGLRSIIQQCGGPDFVRVRIGVGRPPIGTVESWVLGNFDKSECAELDAVLIDATRAVEAVLSEGIDSAMNRFNVRT